MVHLIKCQETLFIQCLFLIGNQEDQVQNGQHYQYNSSTNVHLCLKILYMFAIKQVVMPTLQNRPSVADAAFLFCVMFALKSSSFRGMTSVILGHVADSGNFQQGEVN